jgi:DNA gyrase subunit A
MTDTPPPDEPGGMIEPIEIQEEMERSFLDYAMSVIVSRALPDARDGLKPVHRRILYDMQLQGYRPDRPFVKCAKVTGDTMSRFHPHGNQAIYDALVRLAQPFSVRHPLIDFHGNYGSPDFPPAAERYCVAGDTLVQTFRHGTVRIDQLADVLPNSEADIDLKVVDRHGEAVSASKLFHSGLQPTLRLRTVEGYQLTGTPNHPLLCLESVAGVPMLLWRLLEEIEPGTKVCIVGSGAGRPKDWRDVPFVAGYLESEGMTASGRVSEIVSSQLRSDEIRSVIRPIVEAPYYYATVAGVEDAGIQPVYSIRVESDDHSFVANGFVNHNTECRLSPLSMHLLEGIGEQTVDMEPNYLNDEEQPVVLPSRFPNLLVNGSQGIAVGMATNIPPHNLGEVIDATIHLIDHPDATPDQLMGFVKGPDFPTGAFILGRAGIMDAYRTGRGSIKMRAKAEIEETRQGNQIVVSELPYQSSMKAIQEKIADLVNAREIDGIRSLDDLSAGDETKLVIGLKRDANANVVLNNLYKHTPLQTSFGVNMVALVDGVPRTLNLASALRAYVDHQVEVVRRRSEFRLDKAQKRAHIVEGLLKALDHIDAIITLIKASADRAAARAGLMAAPFEFSEIQAEHILDMTLGRLTRLGRSELEEELAKLRETIAELQSILGDEGKLRDVIKGELIEIRDQYATPRKAEVTLDEGEMADLDLIDDEELVVTMTRAGYIKTVAANAFRTQGRGGRGVQGTRLKEEDIVSRIIHTSAHAFLLFFSNRGKVYRLRAHEVPMKERTAKGTPIVNLLPLDPDEHIQAIIDTRDFPEDKYLFFATRKGQVKKTVLSEYDKSRREGFIAINLRQGDELVGVILTSGEDDIFMVSRGGQTIRFSENDVRAMGRDAAGVRGMSLKSGDEVVSVDLARDDTAILIVTDAGFGKRTQLQHFNRQGRGGQGVRGIKLTAQRGRVVSAFMVGLDDEIIVISSGGVTVRMPVREISSQGRDATGVRVATLDAGQTVGAVAPVLAVDED